MADQPRQMADKARRVLRAATRTADEVAVFGTAVYAPGNALLDLCPWCKKGFRKAINPPFCPYCHRDVLAWNEELQEERELHCKGIRAANEAEKKVKEMELLRKIREDVVLSKARTKKATNRE